MRNCTAMSSVRSEGALGGFGQRQEFGFQLYRSLSRDDEEFTADDEGFDYTDQEEELPCGPLFGADRASCSWFWVRDA